MKFCQNCGAPLDPGVKFCTKCGFKIPEQPIQPAQQPAQPQPVQPQPAQPVQTAFTAPAAAPKKKVSKALIIAIIACVLVVGIVIGAIALIKGKKNKGGGMQVYEPEYVIHYREDTGELYVINKSGKIAKLKNVDSEGYYYSYAKYDSMSDLYGKKAVFSVCSYGDYTLYYYDGEFKKITDDYKYDGSSYGYGYMISEDGSTVVYVSDGGLWSYRNGKSTKIASGVSQFSAMSPNGGTVGYTKTEFSYDGRISSNGSYYNVNGKEYSLGEYVTPIIISNGAELVTISKDSDGSVHVQSGDDSSTRVKLKNIESSSNIVVNVDCTAVIYGSGNGTYMWKKGMDSPEKISSKNLGLADPTHVSGRQLTKFGNIIRYMGTDLSGSVWYDKDYGSNENVKLYTYVKGEMEFLVSIDESSGGFIGAERVYFVKDGSVKYVEKSKSGADPVTVVKSGAKNVGEIGKNLFYAITEDNDLKIVKDGKEQRICDVNDIKNAVILDGRFFYITKEDRILYVTDGGKPKKVSGISGEVKDMYANTSLRNNSGKVAVVVTDTGAYYTTDGGNSFKQLYKD